MLNVLVSGAMHLLLRNFLKYISYVFVCFFQLLGFCFFLGNVKDFNNFMYTTQSFFRSILMELLHLVETTSLHVEVFFLPLVQFFHKSLGGKNKYIYMYIYNGQSILPIRIWPHLKNKASQQCKLDLCIMQSEDCYQKFMIIEFFLWKMCFPS